MFSAKLQNVIERNGSQIKGYWFEIQSNYSVS